MEQSPWTIARLKENRTLKVTVVGLGRVGTVAAAGLAAAGNHVLGVDIDDFRLNALREGRPTYHEPGLAERIAEASRSGALQFRGLDEVGQDLGQVAVIAVDTPDGREPAPGLQQVRNAVSWLRSLKSQDLVIAMKSTVPPGTGLKLVGSELLGTGIGYVANPEFLRMGEAIRDWDSPERIVIGVAPNDYRSAEVVRRMYVGVDAPLLVTDVTSAEMVKYANNAFLATRISFINEIAAMCDLFGASIDAVSEGLAMDARTGSRFYAGVGYGGSCLPRDVRALELLALEYGMESELLRSVVGVNNRQRLLPLRVLQERFNRHLAGLRIGVLGLAFKPGTDDIRDAPALELIRGLAVESADVTVFDPQAGGHAKGRLPPSVRLAAGTEEAAEGAQALCLLTEWEEIVRADWQAVSSRMVHPRFVFDGRNALDPREMRRLGFEYVGVGRNSTSKGDIVLGAGVGVPNDC